MDLIMTQEEKQKYIDAYNNKNKVVVIEYGYGSDIIKTREDLNMVLNGNVPYVSHYLFRICNLSAYQTMMEFIDAQKKHGPYIRFNNFQGRLKLPVEIDECGIYVKNNNGFEYHTYIDLKGECRWADGTHFGIVQY